MDFSSQRQVLRAVLLVALAVLPHSPMVGHAFLWDDAVQIGSNRAITDGVSLDRYFLDRATTSSREDYNTRIYRPLRNLSFRLIVKTFGVAPLAFGVANLMLYALCVLLLWRVIARFATGTLVERERVAFGAAALWAAMPVHTEPVQYASALGDLQSTAAALAALGCVARAMAATERRAFWTYTLLGASLAAMSMLTKESSVTLGGVVALVLFAHHRERRADCAVMLGVFSVVTLAYLSLRTHVVGQLGQDPLTAASFAKGIWEAPWLVVEYARICLMPLGHSVSYVVDYPSRGAIVLVMLAFVALAIWLWRARLGDVALGLGWSVVTLLPVIHLVPLWADLADRFALFASAGLAFAVVALVHRVASRVARVGAVLWGTFGVYVLTCAAANLIEARAWQSDAALWRFAVDREPRSGIAHENLGLMYAKENKLAEALAELDAAAQNGRNGVDLHRWRAMILDLLHRAEEAEAEARITLAIDRRDRAARVLLARLLIAKGALSEAEREIERLRQLFPTHTSEAEKLTQSLETARKGAAR